MSSRSSNLGKGLSACDATSPSGVWEQDAPSQQPRIFAGPRIQSGKRRRNPRALYKHDLSAFRLHHGRHQDHHRPVLCTSACRIHAPHLHTGIALTAMLLGPGHRLSPCHSLRRALQELPHASRCRNLRDRAPTQLALWTSSEPR